MSDEKTSNGKAFARMKLSSDNLKDPLCSLNVSGDIIKYLDKFCLVDIASVVLFNSNLKDEGKMKQFKRKLGKFSIQSSS